MNKTYFLSNFSIRSTASKSPSITLATFATTFPTFSVVLAAFRTFGSVQTSLTGIVTTGAAALVTALATPVALAAPITTLADKSSNIQQKDGD